MRRLLFVLVAVGLAALNACSRSIDPARRAAPDEVEFAKRYLALFPARDFSAIELGMDPPLADEKQRALMRQTAAVFPQETPHTISVVAAQPGQGPQRYSTLSLQYEYPSRTVVAELVLARGARGIVVKAVRVQQLREPLQQLHRFTLAGKTWRHYVMLIAAVAVPILIIVAFVSAIRSPIPGAKWIWVAFVLLGVVRFTLNWTTGALTINFMGLQILGSYFTRPSPFGPIGIVTSIPVGAIVYLVQRGEWREQAAALEADDIEPPPSDHTGRS